MKVKEKKKLLVSFSGGRTSAYMSYLIKKEWGKEYDIKYVFANTGRELEETLLFVDQVDKFLKLDVVWVEANVHHGVKKGSTHKVADFKTASRKGEPFEEVMKKYGMPNISFLHCTRELKANPIHSYIKSLGWEGYYTAIGIRSDEIDRISASHEKNKFIYPLAKEFPTTKYDVNKFWSKQPFDLKIASYQGNCDRCFKKTLRKLLTIEKELRESGKNDNWWLKMEKKYQGFIPKSQKNRKGPVRFNRKNIPVSEIIKLSKGEFEPARDESKDTKKYVKGDLFGHEMDLSNGCIESCEPFA